jgi:drug/metabolite transporter (DMT)-like permease
LYTLIRKGAASRVASLFYLVTPVVAVLSYLLFDERLDGLDILGMALAVIGVSLVNRFPRRNPEPGDDRERKSIRG